MTIDEIKNLSKTNDSILLIESFIESNYGSLDKDQAKMILADMYYFLENYCDAKKTYLQLEHNSLYNKEVIERLIKIFMKLNDYDMAKEYVFKKKAVAKRKEWLKDLIDINIKTGNKIEAKALLLNYLNEEISDDEIINTYHLLINILISKNEYSEAFEYANKYYTLAGKMDKNTNDANIYKAMIYYHSNKFREANNILREVFADFSKTSEEFIHDVIILQLKTYIKLNEYRLASIHEEEYEELMEKASIDKKIEFYTININLYDILKNYYSKENYLKKLNIINIKFEQPKSKKRIIRRSKENINYKIIDKVTGFIDCFNSDITLKRMRDILLLGLKKAQDFIDFDEVITFFISDKVNGFHFKKDRLFDKEQLNIEDTIINDMLKEKKEILYTSLARLVRKKEIITSSYYEELDIKCVFIFPTFKDSKIVGGMIFYGYDYLMLKGHNYELIKLVKKILDDKIRDNNNITVNNIKYEMYEKVFNTIDAYIKYQENDFIFVNKKMSVDFDVPERMNVIEYLSHIDYQDVNRYKAFLLTNDGTINYRFKDKNIFETRKNNNECKTSLLENYDLIIKKEKKENELIYEDFLTKLRNRYAYQLDVLKNIRSNKFSMIYIDIDEFKDLNDCYGHIFGDRVLLDMSKIMVDFFVPYDGSIYRINSDEFLIIVDMINDKRTIDKIITNLLETITYQINKLHKRINLTISSGVLRYRAQLVEKMPEKLLKYLDFAMYQAKKNKTKKESNFEYFNKEDYRAYLLEQQIITHVNESIDQSKIGLLYRQVMNLDGYKVLHYEVSPHIYDLDIDKNEILRVIKLRKLQTKLEKYIIKKVFIEIDKVYKKTNRYFRISIPISYQTVSEKSFLSFISEKIQKNDYPEGLITFDLYGDYYQSNVVVNIIREMGIYIITDDLVNMLKFDIDYLKISFLTNHLDEIKGQKTLSHILNLTKDLNIKLIISNLLNKKQIEILNKLGIKYIHYGKNIFIEDILKKLGVKND